MDLQTLRTRTTQRAGGTYTTAQVDACLNEGLLLFSFATLCVERQVDVILDADTPMRRLLRDVPDFIRPLRVRCVRRERTGEGALWDGSLWDSALWAGDSSFTEVSASVRPIKLAELAALDPAWRLSRDGIVQHYGIQGADVLFVHPAPPDRDTVLRITYAGQAFTLTNNEDVPEIPGEYHPALISYALCTLPLAFGGVELSQYAGEWDKYILAVQECGEWFRNRARAQQYDSAPAELILADKSVKGRKAA